VLLVNDRFGLGFELDEIQEQIIRDDSARIIVNCSRQWGKTTTVAAKAAAEARSGPGLILVIAPVERQARELFRKIRGCLLSASVPRPWPEDNKLSLELQNGARVVALPARGETIRGYTNPRIIIMDEAAFVGDDDYRSIRPMLSHGAKLILMSTPFGKRGFFYEIWTQDQKRWSRYSVPAERCKHIRKEFLEEELQSIGPWWYKQEYECQFLDSIAGFFDMEAVRDALDDGVRNLFDLTQAGKPDYLSDDVKPLFGVNA